MSTNDDEPNVRLQLSNRPENVSLVRAVLAGVAEAVDLDPEQLDEIRTAVTEACNNAVLHAYAGGEGPLEVDFACPPRAASRSWCETRGSASSRATERPPQASRRQVHRGQKKSWTETETWTETFNRGLLR